MILKEVVMRDVIEMYLCQWGMNRREHWNIIIDADNDIKQSVKEHLTIIELPNYELIDTPNPEYFTIAFTDYGIDVTRKTIPYSKEDIFPKIIGNKYLSVKNDETFILYDYLEKHHLTKLRFLQLGNPAEHYDIENGSYITIQGNNPHLASVLHNELKGLFSSTVGFYYHARYVWDFYDKMPIRSIV